MALLIQIGPVIVLLILGFTVGTVVERAHFKRLDIRERELADMLVTDTRTLPAAGSIQARGMVVGQVVISSDYFKTFAATLRKLVGGELHAFESLMVRARREALVRMLASARELGANGVINVRFASSNVGGMRRRQAAAMVEMYAYGTALVIGDAAPR